MRKQLLSAALNCEEVKIILRNGESINGIAEKSNDLSRTKIRSNQGIVWIPYSDVTHVSRVIKMKKNATPD